MKEHLQDQKHKNSHSPKPQNICDTMIKLNTVLLFIDTMFAKIELKITIIKPLNKAFIF